MTSFSATSSTKLRKVVILVYDGAVGLDVIGPAQVFHKAFDADGQKLYNIEFMSAVGGKVLLDCGAEIVTCKLYDVDVDTIDTLLVPGAADGFSVLDNVRLLNWLKTASARVRRVGSICIGALLLAQAGLLNGRMAVTHWRWCDLLRTKFPLVKVLPDQIYVCDDIIWT